MAIKGYSAFPKIQNYWNLTIRLFSVIYRTLVGGSTHSEEKQSIYSTAPADWARFCFEGFVKLIEGVITLLKIRHDYYMVWYSLNLTFSNPIFTPAPHKKEKTHCSEINLPTLYFWFYFWICIFESKYLIGWVLWYINPWRLFNATSYFHILNDL